MPHSNASLFRSDQLTDQELEHLFSQTRKLKTEFSNKQNVRALIDHDRATDKLVLLMFLEPSTRTRMSFQAAALRLGCRVLVFDEHVSSLKKGETQVDTLRNLGALEPDLLVVRHAEDKDLERELHQCTYPVISGGQSAHGHPTQALLDLFTLTEHFKNVQGKNILFVGDVRRGRAALSTLELLARRGANIGWVGPDPLSYQGKLAVERFGNLSQGLQWADAVIGLRLQGERTQFGAEIDVKKYAHEFRLDPKSITSFKQTGIIMHPGPFNQGVDFDEALLRDPRSRVLQQVNNGLYVRMALQATFLNLWKAPK
jgi:aspartate carbamoyltransferase catalytic subunit